MLAFNSFPEALLIGVYLTISFLFSVIEKMTSWKMTNSFYKEHFKGTFIRNNVTPLIVVVLFFELVTLGFLISGLIMTFISSANVVLELGFFSTAITLFLLLIGQRIAKDYQGAMVITVYFILTLLGIYFLNE